MAGLSSGTAATLRTASRLHRQLTLASITKPSRGAQSGGAAAAHLGGLCEVVVGDLREQVVHHVRADVVVDLVEHAVVAVDRRQAPAHVVPLLRTGQGFSTAVPLGRPYGR